MADPDLTYEQIVEIRNACLDDRQIVVHPGRMNDMMIALCDAALSARNAAEVAEALAEDRLGEIDRWISECHDIGFERDRIARERRSIELRVKAAILATNVSMPSWWPWVDANLILMSLKTPDAQQIP